MIDRGIFGTMLVRTSVVALAAVAAMPAAAQPAMVRLDVRPQPLGQALRALAHQAHVQVVFDEARVTGRQSAAVSGTMTVDAAFTRLLRDSGFGVSQPTQGVYVIAAQAAAAAAPAAQAAAEPVSLETTPEAAPSGDPEIVVTGTRLSRPNLKSASPITTVSAAEIKAQGAVNIEEVMNRLPQVQPDSQQAYQNSNGKQKVKLRGLDFNRTLPLIDGQRMATGESIDLNVIPVSLVERVDVLTGGASSVYGSDAVAGVVNYILKKDFQGLQLSANYSFYNHENRANASTPIARQFGIATPTSGTVNDGGRVDVSATIGHNFLDGRLNISAFANYRHADPILFRDRDISGCQLRRSGANVICFTTAESPNGTITPMSGPNSGQAFSNATDGSRTLLAAASVPQYSRDFDRPAAREFDRINAGAFLNFKISPAAQLYGSVLYLRDKSRNTFFGSKVNAYNGVQATATTAGYTGQPYQVNCNNPLLSAQQAQVICGANAGSIAYAPLNIAFGFPGLDGDRSEEKFVNTQTRLTAGVRGEIAEGWKYDIGGVYTHNRDIWQPGGLPYYGKVLKALDVVNVNGVPTCRSVVNGTDPACVPLDVFRAYSSANAASYNGIRNYLFSEELVYMRTVADFYDVTANVTADLTKYGIVSPFAEQGFAIAVGGEYRDVKQDIFRNTRYTEVFATRGIVTQQDVKEANIEAQIPVIQEKPFFKLLQMNYGYRISKYNISPETFDTWKVEAVYSPTSDITFRAGRNRAARAPGVNEDGQLISFNTYPLNDPCANVGGTIRASREACRASGLPDNLYGSATLLCPDGACRERRNGFQIEPEDAMTLSYGFVLTPTFLPRFSLSVDRYKIQVNNVISFAFANFAIDGCVLTADPYYCSRLVRAPDGKLFGTSSTSGFVQAGLTNNYRLYAAGYDFDMQYSLPLGASAGRLGFLLNGSLTTDTGGQNALNQPRFNCTGYFGGNCGQPSPRWTHVFRTTYTSSDDVLNVSLAWRYIDSTRAGQNGGPGATAASVVKNFTRIPVYNYFDLSTGVNIAKKFMLNASVNNLFDKMPPVLTNSFDFALSRGNTVPQRYDFLGRTISVGVTTKF